MRDLPSDSRWRELLLEHRELVDRLARRLLRDEHLAEDVAQETWRIALDRPPRDPRAVPSWLRRVVATLALRWHRDDQRRRRREMRAARIDVVPSAHDMAVDRERHAALVDALLRVREPSRTVLLLRHVEGLPPRHIAVRLGLSVEAVKARLKRGAAELRRELDARASPRAWRRGLLGLLLRRPADRLRRRPDPGALVRPRRSVTMVAGIGLVSVGLGLFAWGGRSGGVPSAIAATDPSVPTAVPGPESLPPRASVSSPHTVVASDAAATDAPGTGTVVVSTTWTAQGPHAAGVAVRAVPYGAAHPLLQTMRGVSDESGIVRLEDVPVGRLVVTGDRGGRAVVEVGAGEVVTASLGIPAGVDVEGWVTDPAGAPVAGARVWLSEPRDHAEGTFRAVSGADGGFAFPSVARHCWIGARAAGFAPTRLHAVEGKPGESLTIQLRLPGPGGSVAGIVTGPSGARVAGAAVLVGVPASGPIESEHGALTLRPPGVLVRTGEHGVFEVDGLAPGSHSVLIRSPPFAPFERGVTVEPGRCVTLAATLEPGATLVGTVLAGGRPLAGARVGSGRDLGFFALTWSRETFLAAFTHADSQGAYCLTGLPSGSVRVWARSRDDGRTQRQLVLVAGQSTRWDPVLGSTSIAGRVVDEAGRPLAGWHVDARKGAGPCTMELPTTDSDGRFVVPVPPGEVDRIHVREPETMRICATTSAAAPGVELTIRVARAGLPSAHLIGSVRDAWGRAVHGVTVRVHRSGEPEEPGVMVDPATQAFRIGPLPPGKYEVVVTAPGFDPRRLGWQHLVPGQTRELGTVVLRRN